MRTAPVENLSIAVRGTGKCPSNRFSADYRPRTIIKICRLPTRHWRRTQDLPGIVLKNPWRSHCQHRRLTRCRPDDIGDEASELGGVVRSNGGGGGGVVGGGASGAASSLGGACLAILEPLFLGDWRIRARR